MRIVVNKMKKRLKKLKYTIVPSLNYNNKIIKKQMMIIHQQNYFRILKDYNIILENKAH